MESYISPKARKGLQSAIHGRGLFAVEEIQKGEIVVVKAGTILTKVALDAMPTKLHSELQLAHDLFIAPIDEADHDKSMMCLNHSCSANIGLRGDIVFVAMRNIKPQEELTLDYALIDNADSAFICECGTGDCRKEITGKDWMKKDLQEKYKGYFSAYIQSLIMRLP